MSDSVERSAEKLFARYCRGAVLLHLFALCRAADQQQIRRPAAIA